VAIAYPAQESYDAVNKSSGAVPGIHLHIAQTDFSYPRTLPRLSLSFL